MSKTSKIFYIQFNGVKWYAYVEDVEDICMQCNTVYCTLNDMHVEDVGDDKNTYYIDF